MSQEFCHILWYNWHLDFKNWPECFRVRFYQMHLREHVVQMCKAVDVATFDSNFEKAKAILANNPVHLEYLFEFHYHIERLAQ